jgi:seryl-tRNA synthetase
VTGLTNTERGKLKLDNTIEQAARHFDTDPDTVRDTLSLEKAFSDLRKTREDFEKRMNEMNKTMCEMIREAGKEMIEELKNHEKKMHETHKVSRQLDEEIRRHAVSQPDVPSSLLCSSATRN